MYVYVATRKSGMHIEIVHDWEHFFSLSLSKNIDPFHARHSIAVTVVMYHMTYERTVRRSCDTSPR